MDLVRRYTHYAFVKKALTIHLTEYEKAKCIARVYDGRHQVCEIKITGYNLVRLARDEAYAAATEWIDENYEMFEPR